jgi:hypothetical protein
MPLHSRSRANTINDEIVTFGFAQNCIVDGA